MDVKVLSLESKYYGKKVIQISHPENSSELLKKMEALKANFEKGLVYCVVEAHEIRTIQDLEVYGFGFVEFRIHSWLRIGDKPLNSNIFPFKIEPVGDEEQLETIKGILQSKTPDDRYYNDYLLDNDIARKRELFNIEKSFNSWPKEFILALMNTQNNSLIGFRSGAFKNEREVMFYLYGVSELHEEEQISKILDHYCIDYLYTMGARIIHTISSGFNIQELNRLILNHGFKIEKSEVVLRLAF